MKHSYTAVFFDCPTGTRAYDKFLRAFRSEFHRFGRTTGRMNRTWHIILGDPDSVKSTLKQVLPYRSELRLLGITEKQVQGTKTVWGGENHG